MVGTVILKYFIVVNDCQEWTYQDWYVLEKDIENDRTNFSSAGHQILFCPAS